MSSSVQIQGQLLLGPSAVQEGTFPATTAVVPLGLSPDQKPAVVNKRGERTLQGVYATLFDADLDDVTQGTFVYLRTANAGLLRITTDDGNGGDVVAVVPIKGLHVHEYDPTKFVKKLEANVSGFLEYIVSGDR